MKKILRNKSTNEGRSFWQTAEDAAAQVETWPAWKRAGINEAHAREESRAQPDAAVSDPKSQP
jgi:hypothetical protein